LGDIKLNNLDDVERQSFNDSGMMSPHGEINDLKNKDLRKKKTMVQESKGHHKSGSNFLRQALK
jgi:hypothetical protein